THQGIIAKISDDTVTVAISTEADECSGCAVSVMCDKQEKLDVPVRHPEKYRIGQPVTVGMHVGMQRRGTLLFFVMPLVLLLAVSGVTVSAGAEDFVVALVSLGVVIGWYALLYAFRMQVRSEVKMVIISN
ncbi:MAG: SoxR reducing system RseC family protein, partial [Muribaculaceae bacterium]|nr:SoxR reducing system RseC family protein [Muribaculaceae bacterium]